MGSIIIACRDFFPFSTLSIRFQICFYLFTSFPLTNSHFVNASLPFPSYCALHPSSSYSHVDDISVVRDLIAKEIANSLTSDEKVRTYRHMQRRRGSRRKGIRTKTLVAPSLLYLALLCPTAVHYIALHCSISHYNTPHCTALQCTILHNTTLQYTAPHYT